METFIKGNIYFCFRKLEKVFAIRLHYNIYLALKIEQTIYFNFQFLRSDNNSKINSYRYAYKN